MAKIIDDEFIPKGLIQAGDEIISLNGQQIRDGLDVIYYSAEETLQIELRRVDGTTAIVTIEKPIDRQLGVELAPDKIRICKANCDFCFVRQQPKKIMRRALYIKDDDYRLSFLHGNFITLTNLTEDDYARIFAQRLSPLYISVHATDDTVRRQLFSMAETPPLLPALRRLIEQGISVHTQMVIVPGINDGQVLDNSLKELADLYPGVQSIGVVPVGLTKYRERLPGVRLNTKEEGQLILQQVDNQRQACQARFDDPLIYAADEWFVQTGRPIPPGEYYEDYVQLENGIGLVQQFLDQLEDDFALLPSSLPQPREVTIITGRSAETFLQAAAKRITDRTANLRLSVLAVDNDFWGHTVTVSGLLTGGDIATRLLADQITDQAVLLPPDCLNNDDLFLDEETPQAVSTRTGCRLHTSTYSLIESLISLLANE